MSHGLRHGPGIGPPLRGSSATQARRPRHVERASAPRLWPTALAVGEEITTAAPRATFRGDTVALC